MSSVNLGDVTVYSPTSRIAPTPQIASGRALLIAISYSKTANPLTGTQNDAKIVQAVIKGRGVPDATTIFLTDAGVAPESVYYPTYNNILRAMKWLYSSSSKADFENPSIQAFAPIKADQLTFCYYSGHGTQVTDTNKDESDGKDEAICPVNVSGNFDIFMSDDVIMSVIRTNTTNTSVVLTLFDCCHSGTVLDPPYVINNGYVIKNGLYPLTSCVLIGISGCQDRQSSYEGRVSNGATHGYLTWAWCSMLQESPRPTLRAMEYYIKRKLASSISTLYQLPQFGLGRTTSIAYTYPF